MVPLIMFALGVITGIVLNEAPKLVMKRAETVIDNVRNLVQRLRKGKKK